MSIFDFLGLGWKPRENLIYRYKRWHRRKHLVRPFPAFQGAGWGEPMGWRKQNLSKVYVVIDEKPYPGTFKVSKGICTIGIVKHKHVEQLYTTDIKNMKFWKKDIGTSKVKFGKTTNITHRYEYVAKVLDSSKLSRERVASQIVRRRGTAIVDTPEGILVAAHHKTWLLPGGGAKKGESREKAAIRELREETGLRATSCKYLFEYDEPDDGRRIRNLHKVFLIEAEGKPKPNYRDVHHLAFWKPDSDIKLSPTTMKIVNRYITEFKNK